MPRPSGDQESRVASKGGSVLGTASFRTARSRPEVSLLALLALAAVVLLDAAPSSLSTNLLLAALITVFSAYRLALEVAVPQPRLLGATFWLFVYASLGVASIAQFGRDEIPSGRYNDSCLLYTSDAADE